MRATHSRYTEEFRQGAVAMYRRGGRTLKQVAHDLGVNHWTLRDWYNKDQMVRSPRKKPSSKPVASQVTDVPQETPEQTIRRLERRVAELEMDREILKKAAAFFAKESE